MFTYFVNLLCLITVIVAFVNLVKQKNDGYNIDCYYDKNKKYNLKNRINDLNILILFLLLGIVVTFIELSARKNNTDYYGCSIMLSIFFQLYIIISIVVILIFSSNKCEGRGVFLY